MFRGGYFLRRSLEEGDLCKGLSRICSLVSYTTTPPQNFKIPIRYITADTILYSFWNYTNTLFTWDGFTRMKEEPKHRRRKKPHPNGQTTCFSYLPTSLRKVLEKIVKLEGPLKGLCLVPQFWRKLWTHHFC